MNRNLSTTLYRTWTSIWWKLSSIITFIINHYFPCQGLDLTFPVDNSLQGCYNRRASCVNNDWGAEVTTNHYKTQNIFSNSHQCQCQVGHLLGRATETGTLMSRWLQFGEKLMSLSSLDGDNVDVVDVDPEFPEYFWRPDEERSGFTWNEFNQNIFL